MLQGAVHNTMKNRNITEQTEVKKQYKNKQYNQSNSNNSYDTPKCLRNKYVFSRPLNVSTDSAFLSDRGKSFQSVGATIAKARSPLVFSFVLGILSRPLLEDLSNLTLAFRDIRSTK